MSKPNLSRQAMDEFKFMLKTRKGDNVCTETPPGRGGTDDLVNAGLVDYVSDDGLVTFYKLTPAGKLLANKL